MDWDEPCYVISVAAKMVGLHPQTLRNYERLGLVRPHRSAGRVRLYSPGDIERLRRISRLTADLGVNLAGVEIILELTERVRELQRQIEAMELRFEEEIGRLQERLAGERERLRGRAGMRRDDGL